MSSKTSRQKITLFLNRWNAKRLFIAAAMLVAILPSSASATNFTYNLANHPDGDAAEPGYGLRLDELFNVSSAHDIFTFDFNHAGSMMQLVYSDGDSVGDYSDDTVRIYGTVFGGLDQGSAFDPNASGFWDVDFLYQAEIVSSGGDGSDIEVAPDSPDNQGTITPLFDIFGHSNGDAIALVDENGSNSYSFRFNGDGHRLDGTGFDPSLFLVGWGWLNHSGNDHVYASDWLFVGQAAEVPEPTTLLLFGAGLLGLARKRAGAQKA